MIQPQQTLDEMREDVANVWDFLAALGASVPGSVPPDLLAMLEGATRSDTALAVLQAAIRKADPKGGRR